MDCHLPRWILALTEYRWPPWRTRSPTVGYLGRELKPRHTSNPQRSPAYLGVRLPRHGREENRQRSGMQTWMQGLTYEADRVSISAIYLRRFWEQESHPGFPGCEEGGGLQGPRTSIETCAKLTLFTRYSRSVCSPIGCLCCTNHAQRPNAKYFGPALAHPRSCPSRSEIAPLYFQLNGMQQNPSAYAVNSVPVEIRMSGIERAKASTNRISSLAADVRPPKFSPPVAIIPLGL